MKRAALIGIMAVLPISAQPLNRLQAALVSADRDLKAGNFDEADRRLRKLSGAIGEKFGSGSEAMYTVAVIASFREIGRASCRERVSYHV